MVCLAALPLLVTSCGEDSPDSQQVASKGKIGMTCMDLTNPFFKLIANMMEREAGKYGYELVALSGELDPAKQNNQLADFAAQGCDAIFLNPVDSKSAGEGVKKRMMPVSRCSHSMSKSPMPKPKTSSCPISAATTTKAASSPGRA